MKVIESNTSNSMEVVPDSYGTTFQRDGKTITRFPLPVCRIPIGYGRTKEQATKLAELIAKELSLTVADPERDWSTSCSIYGIAE